MKKTGYRRILGRICFTIYVLFLVYFLIFSDWYGRDTQVQNYDYNLVLFKEIKRFWKYREQLGMRATLTNLAGNVMIFVPFGFFMTMAGRRRSFVRTVLWSGGLSLCVEVFQLLARVGRFDVDDMFLNMLGGMVGFFILTAGEFLGRKDGRKKKKRKD